MGQKLFIYFPRKGNNSFIKHFFNWIKKNSKFIKLFVAVINKFVVTVRVCENLNKFK